MIRKRDSRLELALGVLACLLCALHLWTSLSWTEGQEHRLRPRRLMEPIVRGRTYHVHVKEPIDVHHRNQLAKRLRVNGLARPHFVARRQILSAPAAAAAPLASSGAVVSDFLGRDHEDAWPNVSCSTCSIVGYSGHLLNSKLGEKIDEADCVFRLGRAPSLGYHPDVGLRTTFRVLDASTFYEVLRKPEKLVWGPLWTSAVVVFGTPSARNRAAASNSNAGIWLRLKKLPANVTVLNLKRTAEHLAARSLAESTETLGYHLSGTEPSGLWHAARLAEKVGCRGLHVYGVPDPKFCKRHRHERSLSRYWDFSSTHQCVDGGDSGHNGDPRLPDASQLSVADRRALRAWSKSRTVRFSAPEWPDADL